MKAVFKAANQAGQGRGGSRPAAGGQSTTGPHATKKTFHKNGLNGTNGNKWIELRPREIAFLLRLLREHRVYYGQLVRHEKCGEGNRRKYEEVEGICRKLEVEK